LIAQQILLLAYYLKKSGLNEVIYIVQKIYGISEKMEENWELKSLTLMNYLMLL
jgi:hypothetical protein